ncbi:MAG TPA: helix-turn-helix transcriptional regulator [Pseudonocardia sp.]|uniref:helix-turn-helix transcriptional regulator n=1 Tax=Pseudonocardia sp. TaxID=60912 RepID=UPI002EDA08A5
MTLQEREQLGGRRVAEGDRPAEAPPPASTAPASTAPASTAPATAPTAASGTIGPAASPTAARGTGPDAAARSTFARNVARQRELYGEPLGDRIRRLQAALGVSQARLADGLGLSTAMLSQLVSARRVKIGDPAVLSRLALLDRYVRRLPAGESVRADELLAQLRQTRPHLGLPGAVPRDPGEALRAVAPPAQLAAAASVLGPRFPAIAELLRRAAADQR